MDTRSPPVVTRVVQLGLGPSKRNRFLLAAVVATAAISPPSVSHVKATPAPAVTTGPSPAILARSVPVFGGSKCMLTGKTPKARLLLYEAGVVSTPAVIGELNNRRMETRRLIVNTNRKAQLAALGAAPAPAGSVYPPPVFHSKSVNAPTVEVVEYILGATQDDGNWPNPSVFVPIRRLWMYAIDLSPQSISPPQVTRNKATPAPTVRVSNNTQISVPSVLRVKLVQVPSVAVSGNPLIAVPVTNKTKTVHAPTVVVSTIGINPAPVTRSKTVLPPTVTVSSTKKVKHVGRVVTEAKLLGSTQELTPPFNFKSGLAVGETILTAQVTASVYSGVDSNPSAILSGSPTIDGTMVHQIMTGGVVGCVYVLLCSVTTSNGQDLDQSAYFYVQPDVP